MKGRLKSGFTLFELLVTLTVITVIAAAGFLSIARGTDERSLEKAADMLHSMVRIARTQAITNGVHSRLIISLDQSDASSYLRKVGVVIEASDQGYWKAVERGVVLPEGVYVVPQSGSVSFTSDWPATGRRSIYRKTNTESDDSAIYDYEYPLQDEVSEDSGTSWLCIQFSPNGRLSSAEWGGGGLVPVSNQLVLAKGNWDGSKVAFRSAADFIAIAFKQSGSSYQTQETELVDDEVES
ncbi:pilus assembly FimT family protein [Pelagicoccus albus]|uniref:Prepilin-type N-terminal cleavage/methylation domain-containing protein n=1 Tax=Pelagicoccus albus TaxID=415222 RepID=A0A7X1B6K4_9BACT|nr:prepilin-type N-terminal cleavage/methylation domain-containing protein [Pelagicoccus albus]MBC2605383.1 prepilin-type N-terminal cleavage/methylation domain-containing protein [Pelagicoccus albus]